MIEFDPTTGDSFGHLEFMEARRAYERGEWSTALTLFESSQSREPHFKTLFFLAKTLEALGRENESFGVLGQAYEANPRHSQTAVEYARKLMLRHEIDEARRILQATIAHNTTYNPARRLLDELGQE